MDRDHKRALPFRLRTVLYSFQPAATGIRLPGGSVSRNLFVLVLRESALFF